MTALDVAGLRLELGAFVLGELSLNLPDDEIMVVLGPNGAGKSVLLETIAGFHRAVRGRIAVRGRDVTALSPEKRHIGFVVQNFGLFPHLTVAQNIALAASLRRDGAERRSRVDVSELLRRFGIAHLADSGPVVLSPGEKQRAALARAEASHPDLFLLDEPFSALDAQARDGLRFELARFLRDMRAPAIFVTHDRVDVAALGTRVALMREGRIIQCGAVDDVFRRPTSRTAAEILGIENRLPGRVEAADGRYALVRVGDAVLRAASAVGRAIADEVCVAIRAEDIRLTPSANAPAIADENRLAGAVVALQPLGPLTRVVLDCGIRLVACLMTRDVAPLGLAAGAPATAIFSVSDTCAVEP